jgi:hypothetical protein
MDISNKKYSHLHSTSLAYWGGRGRRDGNNMVKLNKIEREYFS